MDKIVFFYFIQFRDLDKTLKIDKLNLFSYAKSDKNYIMCFKIKFVEIVYY